MEVEEDQFSGEEASDDIDQRLHETISCIEKSLEETPESPNYQDIPKSKTLLDLPVSLLHSVFYVFIISRKS